MIARNCFLFVRGKSAFLARVAHAAKVKPQEPQVRTLVRPRGEGVVCLRSIGFVAVIVMPRLSGRKPGFHNCLLYSYRELNILKSCTIPELRYSSIR